MAPTARTYKIGYARVSTLGQKLDAQLDILDQVGCDKTFTDHGSGITALRPGWAQLLAYVRPGDTVVITEVSRMSRSLAHLLEIVQTFEQQGIALVSVREHIDTATASGRCFLAIMGAIAQMERELKAERAAAGRAAAKARGRTGDGRAPTQTSWNRHGFCISIPTRRRGSVPHGGHWTADVVQLSHAGETSSTDRISTRTLQHYSVTPLIWNFARFVLVPPYVG
jgi:predicted site-specific integrase-resolvase